jgi:hypothetical protein
MMNFKAPLIKQQIRFSREMENGTSVQRRFASVRMELYNPKMDFPCQTIGIGGQEEENVTLDLAF